MKAVRSEAGFSLVEMMMVVAIIGLMTGAVVLAMPTKNDGLAEGIKKTERSLIALSRQSVMSGRVIGLRFTQTGFVTQLLTDDGWQDSFEVLKPEATEWGPYILSGLQVAGNEIDLTEETSLSHVWFLPTSEATAFQLTFSSASEEGYLSVNQIGKTEVRFDG